MHKLLNGLPPEYLSKIFVKNSFENIRQLQNAETDLLSPMRKASNGQKGISFRVSKLWNQLDDVKQYLFLFVSHLQSNALVRLGQNNAYLACCKMNNLLECQWAMV